ncbi:MAG: cation:proton antiporter [Acidimicrobiales bacterium]
MSWGDIAVVAALIVLWSAFSGQAERAGITAPLLFTVAGLVLGGEHALHVTLTAATLEVSAALTLVLILFTDAARLQLPSLRHDVGLTTRLLAVGLPLTILAGALASRLVVGPLGLWMTVLLAACLAPTDAGLGAGIVTDRSVPSRVRRVLNVESGLNDGIVAPLVTLAIAVLVGQETHASDALLHALHEIGVGAVVGIAAGTAAGWLLAVAVRRGWADTGTTAVATVALALGTYALALSLHGNGFVAAFLAGLCFGVFRSRVGTGALVLTEGSGHVLSCLVWFAFGAAMLRPALSSPDALRALGYAALSLTVIRMVPVALALVGTRLGTATVAFIGWFGPRGLASVVFALLAFDDLGHEASTLVTVVSVTVACSVVAHGLSANPLIARYARHSRARDPGHPLLTEVPVPSARRTVGTAAAPGGGDPG